MIDLLKLRVANFVVMHKIWNNPKLKLFSQTKYKDVYKEKFKTKKVKQFNGVVFLLTEHHLDIIIKPHYYYNSYKHNSDDFTIYESVYVITKILDDLDIYEEINHFRVINIEFGLNFIVPLYDKDLIGFTEYWKRTQGLTDSQYKYSKKFSSTDANGRLHFYKVLKFYCKGIQENAVCSPDTLRFEIKSMQFKYISKVLGIENVGDLLDLNVYDRMAKEILTSVKELLIIDNNIDVENTNLSDRELKKLKEYLNPYTWYKTLQLNDRSAFTDKKKRYFKLLNKMGVNIHTKLYNVISDKINYLINHTPEIKHHTPTYSTMNNFIETPTYSTINIVGIYGCEPIKRCIITGLDISFQQDCSIMLSKKGVEYYFKFYPNIYEKLVQRHLTPKWKNTSQNKKFEEIAHNIRDTKRNMEVKLNRLYQEQQFRLFDFNIFTQ